MQELTKWMIRVSYIKFYCFVLLFVCLNSHLSAQIELSKGEEKTLKSANSFYENGDFLSAKELYQKLYKKGLVTGEISFKLGKCIFNAERDYEVASEYFLKANELKFPESYFYLAQWYHFKADLDKAIEYYKSYMAIINGKIEGHGDINNYITSCNTAKEMLADPVDIEVENLGPTINTVHAEYAPVISMDESFMLFTARRPNTTGGSKDASGRYNEDIYMTTNIQEKWSDPKPAGPSINTENNDATVALSGDGFVLITNKSDESGKGGDLYWSNLSGDAWQEPRKFDEGINTEHLETGASYSADMRTLFLSSNRPGGFGGKDIYKVEKLPDGRWSLPENLGDKINTVYDEETPFIHSDNNTLYFSSNGHSTMGGYDIFKASRNLDKTWNVPENLGSPINTTGDDLCFVLSAEGKHGYLSSKREGGAGNYDIYVVHLADEPKQLTIIRGIVSAGTGDDVKPVGAKIIVTETETQKLQGIYTSNSKTGKYLILIPPDTKYSLRVNVKGYQPIYQALFYESGSGFNIINKPLQLTKKKK